MEQLVTQPQKAWSMATIRPVPDWWRPAKCWVPWCSQTNGEYATRQCEVCALWFCRAHIESCAKCGRGVCGVCTNRRIGAGTGVLPVWLFHPSVRDVLRKHAGGGALCADCVVSCMQCGEPGFPVGWLQCAECHRNLCEKCIGCDEDTLTAVCATCNALEAIRIREAAHQLMALSACK